MPYGLSAYNVLKQDQVYQLFDTRCIPLLTRKRARLQADRPECAQEGKQRVATS